LKQKELKILHDELIEMNILFRLNIESNLLFLELHPDFDIDGYQKYILDPCATFIVVEPIGQTRKKMWIKREKLLTSDHPFPTNLRKMSSERRRKTFERIDPTIYFMLQFKLVPDVACIIIKFYVEAQYESWNLVFR